MYNLYSVFTIRDPDYLRRNAPFILGFRSVVYALAVGNTCILKASELAPACALAIASILQAAGLPAGCLNVLHHRPDDAARVTRVLIEHPSVKKINFTGSTNIGRVIARLAGESLKPVLLELGGKASTIVLGDADLQQAALACVQGAFLHAGQICMSCERIIVHSSVTDPFLAELRKAVRKTAHRTDDKPVLMVTEQAAKRVEALTQNAIRSGAKPLDDVNYSDRVGAYLHPIVLQDVTKDQELYYTESFGPVVVVITVDTDEQAVAVANDTEYGLSAALFTQDLAKAFRLANKIESG
jgi:acyl-CoA reductase-like NAD-dependent aldehyde dehydrogenase